MLWSHIPNHQFLHNTGFELSDQLKQSGYVVKPIVGRCSVNIRLVNDDDAFLAP